MVHQPPLPTQATCLLFVGASRRPSFVVEMCRVRVKELGPSEVLVRVRLAGLCASDVRRFVSEDDECALFPEANVYEDGTSNLSHPHAARYPTHQLPTLGQGWKRIKQFPHGQYGCLRAKIPGHEAVGDVIASRRPGVEVGSRVVFSSSNWCSACEWCRRGAHVACENVTKYGHPPLAALSSSEGELGGTLSSHVLLRSGTAVCSVPPSVSDGHALLACCPLATALAGVLRLTTCHTPLIKKTADGDVGAAGANADESRPRPTALVQGCGLVGILACAVLSESGFHVYCEDTNVTRLRLASKFHAQPVFRDTGPLTPSPALPDRLDAVVIALGSRLDYCDRGYGGGQHPAPPLLQGQAGQLLRRGGTLLLLGQPSSASKGSGGATAILEAADILGKGICVIGASEYEPDNLRDAVQFLEATEGKFPYSELLSPAYALSDFQSALTSALERKFLRVLLRPSC